MFKKFTMRWWEVGIFKVSLLSFGIVIGMYWKDILLPSSQNLTVVAAIGFFYILYIWCIQQAGPISKPSKKGKK